MQVCLKCDAHGSLEMQNPKNRQKWAIWTPSHKFVGTEACTDNRKKNLLNSNIFPSPTLPHNMVNFGPLTAEICSGVWITPANFNGFRVLAALLHGTVYSSGRQ